MAVTSEKRSGIYGQKYISMLAGNSAYAPIPLTSLQYIGVRKPTGATSFSNYNSRGTIAGKTYVVVNEYIANGSSATKIVFPLWSTNNGSTWTLECADISNGTGVGPNGGQIILCGSTYYMTSAAVGYVYYSTNLSTWTHKSVGGTAYFTSLATNGTGVWASPSGANTPTYYISSGNTPTDSWNQGQNSPNSNVNSLDYWNGYYYFGLGNSIKRTNVTNGSLTSVYTSTGSYGVTYNGSVYVSNPGNGSVNYSSDGSSWSTASPFGSNTPNEKFTVDSSSGTFYSGCYVNGSIWKSTNGSSWTNVDTGHYFNTATFPFSGGLVTSGAYGMSYSTDNGSTFTEIVPTFGNKYAANPSIAYGSGKWVISASDNGYGNGTSYTTGISYSTDGTTWTFVSLYSLIGNAYGVNAVHYANNRFIGWVQSSNQIVYSTDGVTWSLANNTAGGTTFTTSTANSYIYGNGIYIGTSNGGGYYVTSTDGVNWTERSWASGPPRNIAFNGSKFVAVGAANIQTSTDGTTWTNQTIPSGAGSTFLSVAYSSKAGCFITGDNAGHYWTSTDGVTWTSRTTFWNTSASSYVSFYGDSKCFITSNTDGAQYFSINGITWTKMTAGITGATPGLTGENSTQQNYTYNFVASNGSYYIFADSTAGLYKGIGA